MPRIKKQNINNDLPIYIVGMRGAGKTDALIKVSAATGIPIAVKYRENQRRIADRARDLGLAIPGPVTYHNVKYMDDLVVDSYHRIGYQTVLKGKVLIDDYRIRCYDDLQSVSALPVVACIDAAENDIKSMIISNPTLWSAIKAWWQLRKETL